MSHLFAHILMDMICKWIVYSLISFLNESERICLYTSIAIFSTQLNGFSYY